MLRRITIVTLVSIAATMSGLLREASLAGLFGTSSEADAAATVVFLHDAIAAAFVTGGFSLAAVPLAARLRNDLGDHYASALVRSSTLVVFGLAAIVALMAFPVIPWIVTDAANSSTSAYATPIAILRGALPGLVLFAASCNVAAFLPAFGEVTAPSLGRLLWNAGLVAGLFAASRLPIAAALSVAVAVGALANASVVMLAMRGTGLGTRSGPGHPLLGELIRVAGPSLAVVAASALLLGIWERYLLASVGVGSIAVVNYAQRASYMASTMSTAVHTVAFSVIALEQQGAGLTGKGTEAVRVVLRRYLLVVVPLAAFMLVARHQIVAILFMRGAFDLTAANRTAAAFAVYTFAIIPVFVMGMSLRILFTVGRPAIALSCLAAATIIAACADWLLLPVINEIAIPAGYTVGMAVASLAALMAAERAIGGELLAETGRALVGGTLVAGSGAALCLLLLQAWPASLAGSSPALVTSLARLATAGFALLLGCFAAAWLLRIPELNEVARILRRVKARTMP